MKTIGFTNVYYTLWEVSEPYAQPVFYNGMQIGVNMHQNVIYCQNLSMDLEKAKEKVAAMSDGRYAIDLDMRGHSSFTRVISSNIKNREEYYPHDCFSFGRMEGVRFMEATDVWQLKRAMAEEKSLRRRAWARRRLIELGELVKYKWSETQLRCRNKHDNVYEIDGEIINIKKDTLKGDLLKRYQANGSFVGEYEEEQYEVIIKHNYATPHQIVDFKIKEKNGHFFNDGQKVELEVKEIKSFSFDGAYGRTYVVCYETRDNKIVKYVGARPVNLYPDKKEDLIRRETSVYCKLKGLKDALNGYTEEELKSDNLAHNKSRIEKLEKELKQLGEEIDNYVEGPRAEFVKISATIKHSTYKGPETKLLRIKVLKG